MEFEKDYVIRLVKEIARLIAFLITEKKDEEEFGDERLDTSLDGLYGLIIRLADNGKINEAENLLFNQLDKNDIEQLYIAIAFYEHINEYADEFLNQHSYDRAEIIEGLNDLVKEYGISEKVLSLLTY